jgi:hypothetical protein
VVSAPAGGPAAGAENRRIQRHEIVPSGALERTPESLKKSMGYEGFEGRIRPRFVIPAKAGIQRLGSSANSRNPDESHWIHDES